MPPLSLSQAQSADNGLILKLRCPSCGKGNCSSEESYRCPSCSFAVALREGFPSLTGEDDFYEHQCTNTLKLPLVDRIGLPWRYLVYLDFLFKERHRRNRFFRRVTQRLPKKQSVLDIGCGGGMEIWRNLGQVVGLSNSITGLAKAREVYSACVHSDLNEGLPFPDSSFDYIIASDIVGHFDEAGRDRLLSEIKRCLKPGGRFIAVIETIGKWFDHYQKRFPGIGPAYIEAGIKRAGHIGLEAPRLALKRLEQAGFACEHLEILGAYPGYVEGFFTPEFGHFPPPTRSKVVAKAVARVVRHNAIATRITDNIFGMINSVALKIRGVDWADGLMVVCRVNDAS